MRSIVLVIFFLSGISGLVYQIVWTRMLVLVFGNTLLATSTVLSAFMAGLAAGSFGLGEYIDRKPRRLLKVYSVLEAGIGIFGLAFPLLFAVVAPLYTSVYQGFGENLAIANLFRFLVCFLLIVLPTFCMGGTLPVLLKLFAERFGKLGYQVGFLYGLNTAGAVVGCAAVGYWLLGAVGLQRTTWTAVAINLGVAVIAWLLPEKGMETHSAAASEGRPGFAPTSAHGYARPVVIAVLIGIALSSRKVGVVLNGRAAGERLTWAIGAFNDWFDAGERFDESASQLVGRVTALPFVSEDESSLLHLGFGARHTDAKQGVRFRSRPESNKAPDFVDTGHFEAEHAVTYDLEALVLRGSVWLSGEYVWIDVASPDSGDPRFGGYHVTGGWALTGEMRSYNRNGQAPRTPATRMEMSIGSWIPSSD